MSNRKEKKSIKKKRMAEVKQKLWKIKGHNKLAIEIFNGSLGDSCVHAKKRSLADKKKGSDAKKITNFMKTSNSKQNNWAFWAYLILILQPLPKDSLDWNVESENMISWQKVIAQRSACNIILSYPPSS